MEIPYSSSSTTLIPFPASKIILCSDRSTILLDEVQIVLCVRSLLRAPGFFFVSPCFPDIACPAAGFCVCCRPNGCSCLLHTIPAAYIRRRIYHRKRKPFSRAAFCIRPQRHLHNGTTNPGHRAA